MQSTHSVALHYFNFSRRVFVSLLYSVQPIWQKYMKVIEMNNIYPCIILLHIFGISDLYVFHIWPSSRFTFKKQGYGSGSKYKQESTNSSLKCWSIESNIMPTYLKYKYSLFSAEPDPREKNSDPHPCLKVPWNVKTLRSDLVQSTRWFTKIDPFKKTFFLEGGVSANPRWSTNNSYSGREARIK